MSITEPIRLLDEFRQRRRDLLRMVGPGVGATIVAFIVAFYFVEPPPPKSIVIATGERSGRYYESAKAYAKSLERNGIALEIRETAGSVENFDLLLHDDAITLSIVQGGTEPAEANTGGTIEAIASLYFEPLWVFHRADLAVEDLGDLKGCHIALGETGSGSHMLAIQLLAGNGVRDGEDGTTFLEQNAVQAAPELEAGRIDVAMFVLGPDATIVRRLLQNSEIALMDFARQRAYERRYPYLKGVILEQGVVDFEQDLPRKPVRLIAPAANLVATRKLHEAFVPLLLEAALEQHDDGGVLADAGELPSLEFVSFPVNSTARHYLTHGPSFFQRHLSFWIASLLDRTKIMIIPLVALLIPLIKIAPPVYRWQIRSRIYRWYRVLRRIDQELRKGIELDTAEHAATLQAMSKELDTVHVPLSYMEEFYNLRLHINLVQNELEKLKEQQNSTQTQTVTPTSENQ